MDNQQPNNFDQKVLYWLLTGVIIGAVVVFAIFMIGNFRIVRIADIDKLVPGDEIVKTGSSKFSISDIDSSGKDLCGILGVNDINALVSGLNITRAEENSEHPFANCNYFTAQSQTPAVVFADSLASMETSKRMQEELGAEINELQGVGDEAFSTANRVINNRSVTVRSIVFRVGEFVYSTNSSILSEGQLQVVAQAAAERLR